MNGGERSGEGRRLENPIKKEEGGKEVPEGKERERETTLRIGGGGKGLRRICNKKD